MSAQAERPDEARGTPPGTPIDTLRLWELLFGSLEGYLVTFVGRQSTREDARPNELDNTQQRSWRYPDAAEQAAAYLEAKSSSGCDAYFGVHLFRESGNRRKDNALDRVRAAWVDGDGAKIPSGWPQPSVVIESSPGREHYYWLLSEPVSPEEAALLSKRLAYGMEADKGKWGLGTVLRVPGTMNFKRAEPHEVIGVLTHERRYSTSELSEALPELPETRKTPSPAMNVSTAASPAGGPPVRLSGKALDIYEGRSPIASDSGVDRSATIMQIASVLYNAGLERSALVPALEERDRTLGFDKYLSRPSEYDRIVDKLEAGGRNTPAANGAGNAPGGTSAAVTPTPQPFTLTDYGNAERLVARHGEDLRYCYAWRKWLAWNGRRWAIDDTGELGRRAKDTVRSIYAEAAAEPEEAARKALAAHAKSTESNSRLKAMITLAKSEPGIPIRPADLDTDGWLLNVSNGTLDLRSGTLREHRREDLITRLAPVEYHPDAQAPLWEQTLERILPGPELREFVRRYLGYSLTGDVSEQCLAIAHGVGANGKTTIIDAVMAVMGEYAMQGAPDLLIAKRDAHPTELADLHGKRLVSTAEVEQGRRLAESRVKQLTGGDRVRARRMNEDFWEFAPTHKLLIATNHKPEVRGTDLGIWRRIKLIPFSVTIPAEERDEALPRKLAAARPGILAWLVRGCLDWQRDGLREPQEVTDATAHYRAEMDTLAAWVADCCVEAPGAWATLKNLYDSYAEWCADSRESPETKRRFGVLLTERGYEADKGTGNVAIRRGIGLRTDPENDPPEGDSESNSEAEIVIQDSAENEKIGPDEATNGRASNSEAEIVTQELSNEETQNSCKEAENQGRVTQSYPICRSPGEKFPHGEITHKVDNYDNSDNSEVENPASKNTAAEAAGGVRKPGRRLTEDEVRRVQKLISEGMSPAFARAEVLGEEY